MDTKETRILPVTLTAEERAAKSLEFSTVYEEIKVLESQLKSTSKRIKDEMESKRLVADKLAKIVNTGIEEREVECFERQDREKLIIELYRCDTGELVRSRPMTANERQLVMFPTEKLHVVKDEKAAEKTGTAGDTPVVEIPPESKPEEKKEQGVGGGELPPEELDSTK